MWSPIPLGCWWLTMGKQRAMGGHHSPVPRTESWITPPEILAALGKFDLDPCACDPQPWPCADRSYTEKEDGLARAWTGRIWLNPPYTTGVIEPWMRRLADHHGRGTALIFARTDTRAFHQFVWRRASAVLFIMGRLNFYYPDGRRASGNAGAPSVLVAYGDEDAAILSDAALEKKIIGAYVPLKRYPR